MEDFITGLTYNIKPENPIKGGFSTSNSVTRGKWKI